MTSLSARFHGPGHAPPGERSWLHQALGLGAFLLATAAAPVIGTLVTGTAYYSEIEKPAWSPPGWLFGPVWTVLYAAMAVAAWLAWRPAGWTLGHTIYGVQLVLNALWTPIFFGLERPGLALVDIVVLLAAVAATLVAFWPRSRVAGLLIVPYLGWVAFATVLNATIWQMNA